jgi:hypothetical protein
MEKYGRARQATDDNKTRRMRSVSWLTKTTDTQSEYAFPRQQLLCERASMLLSHVHCLACFKYCMPINDNLP